MIARSRGRRRVPMGTVGFGFTPGGVLIMMHPRGGEGKETTAGGVHPFDDEPGVTELANHLVDLGVQRVVMEATSDYWKPVFYLLEAHGPDRWLVNARDVKHLSGRPKTDLLTELPRGFWGVLIIYLSPSSAGSHPLR